MTNEVINKIIDVHCLEEIIEYAWKQAIKYRFDPVASRIHENYLQMVKDMKKEIYKEKND